MVYIFEYPRGNILKKKTLIFHYNEWSAFNTVPIQVATPPKAWVFGRSTAGIVGSNTTRETLVGFGVGLITFPEEFYWKWYV
jgi:hypothetical protein